MKHLCLFFILLFSVNVSSDVPSNLPIVIELQPIIIEVNLDTIQVSPAKKLPDHVQDFIASNILYARKVLKRDGVPIAITLGVAALESGWGRSYAAKERNNYFGLHGGSKVYKSKRECYRAFGKLLSKVKRYKPLQGVTDYKLYCKLLHTTGYNPYSFYPDKLQKVIEYANLQNLK